MQTYTAQITQRAANPIILANTIETPNNQSQAVLDHSSPIRGVLSLYRDLMDFVDTTERRTGTACNVTGRC